MVKYIEAEAAKKELKKTFLDDWIKAHKTIDRYPAGYICYSSANVSYGVAPACCISGICSVRGTGRLPDQDQSGSGRHGGTDPED